jgi:hypothetical protein
MKFKVGDEVDVDALVHGLRIKYTGIVVNGDDVFICEKKKNGVLSPVYFSYKEKYIKFTREYEINKLLKN